MPSPRFKVNAVAVKGNAYSEDIRKAQDYLQRFGYVPDKVDRGVRDQTTEAALRKLQETFGLPVTGELDEPTAEFMNRPRCGVPDFYPLSGRGIDRNARFGVSGCSYFAHERHLNYAFSPFSADLQSADQAAAVERAFNSWQTEIATDFDRVGPSLNPHLPIGWFRGDHGDGSPFDGAGNVLAHAFYPPPCGGSHAGKCHFDDAELWATAHGANQFDIETVALHEIGHLLGLTHSAVAGSVMFPTYGGQLRDLQPDDINGIRSLYGRRGPALQVLGHLQNIGDVGGIDNQFVGTRGQSRRLEGFQIDINPAVPGLGLRYMAHLQNIGDVPFVTDGNFVGTRGESRRLEGFAIETTGANANNFDVVYMAHLQNIGDTALARNGQFCGTRGESRRCEGIVVRVEPR